jgi:broad specificity phosphatase PhoE
MNKIYLVRHGENQANPTKEFSCRKVDYPLTGKGRLQAGQTAAYFRGLPVHGVYASPLLRAVETAREIGQAVGLEVQVRENFRELNVGDLEELPPTPETWAIHNNVILQWLQGTREACFPGGENFWQASQRLVTGLEEILRAGKPGESYVIVAHGGIFFTGIGELCPDLNIDDIIHRVNHNCSISELDVTLQDGKIHGSLVRWADTSHLHGEAADLVSGLPDE